MYSPSAHPDDLGIHAVFLRRLAQALLRSPDLAEDAVQETLFLAWRKRPDGPHPRGWLVRTLQNVSRNMRRASGRRSKHEGDAPALAQTAPEALRAREQLRKELLDAVLLLPEGERECILLRYDQGFPPRRIAAALDVPVHTVQNRLRRGRERLRERLAETHGASSGDEGGWRAALVALVPPLLPAAGGGGLLGGLLVSKFAWTSVAAVLLLGLGWALWPTGPAPGATEVSPDDAPAPSLAQAEPGGATLEGNQNVGVVSEAETPVREAMIHGTVRSEVDGAPIAGARVVAFEYAQLRRLETFADASGRFAFEATRGSVGAFHLRADLAPYAGVEAVRVTPSVRGIDLRLSAGGVLHGTVAVAQGTLPPDLRVRAVPRQERGNARRAVNKFVAAALPGDFVPLVEVDVDAKTGAFELGPLPAGRHAIELRVPGRPPQLFVPSNAPYRWEAGYELAAGARVDVGELTLNPDATLRVHLIDARTEETLRRAYFSALTEGSAHLPPMPLRVTAEDKSGIFRVPAEATASDRLSLEATVEVPGYARADIDVSGSWGDRPLVIRMQKTSSVLLRVDRSHEDDGQMIAFVRRASDEDVLAVTPVALGVTTEIPDLPAGQRLELLVFGAGLDGRRHAQTFILEPGEDRELTVGGPNRTAIAGTVRMGGRPVEDVLVAIDDASGTGIRVWTGRDGRFRIDGVPPGRSSVFFNLGEERAMVRRMIQVVEGRLHDASVDLGIEVRGTITQSPSSEGAPSGQSRGTLPDLSFVSPSGLTISVRPTAEGAFQTWVQLAGSYQLRSDDADWYVVGPAAVDVPEQGVSGVSVQVARDPGDGSIDFEVRDAKTGQPVPGITAHFSGPQTSGVSTGSAPGMQRLDELNLGTYRVQLVAPGYVPAQQRLTLVLDKRNLTIPVELHPAEAVRVASFSTGSRGRAAGLQVGDLIVSYDGKRVTSLTTLRAAMQGKSAADVVVVGVRRGGQDLELDLPAGRLGIQVANARLEG